MLPIGSLISLVTNGMKKYNVQVYKHCDDITNNNQLCMYTYRIEVQV